MLNDRFTEDPNDVTDLLQYKLLHKNGPHITVRTPIKKPPSGDGTLLLIFYVALIVLWTVWLVLP